MAKNKKPTGVKKVQYHVGKSWQRPQFKLLYLVLFAFVFGWIGYKVFFAHAATPYPTDSNQIVAELQSLAGSQALKDPSTHAVTNLIAPGDVIVAGDGTLYCNTSGDGSTTTGTLSPGELKQFFDSVNGADVHGLAQSQHATFDANTKFETVSVLAVNASDQAQVIYNQGDTTGTFARTSAKLQQQCKAKGNTAKTNSLPEFKDLNQSSTNSSVTARLKNVLLPSASANISSLAPDCSSTRTTNCFFSGGGMTGFINNHRSSYDDSSTNRQPYTYESNHPPISLSREACINTVAENWAYHMAHYGLAHNANIASQIASHCYHGGNGYTTDWTSIGEDVGVGPGPTAVGNAFLGSICHHENIDARALSGGSGCGFVWTYAYERYKYFGVGAYVDGKGNHWYTVDFANWY